MSKLSRRMLGLGDKDKDVPAKIVPPPPGTDPSGPPNPRFVGLRDAALSGFYSKATGEVFAGVPVGPDDVVVDVGCGEGAALGFCATAGAPIIAIDVHEETLADARAFLADKGDAPKEFHVGRAEELPLPDETATRVLCMEVLEHVDSPPQALAEMYRIGKPGALYLLTVPDARGEEFQKIVAPDSYFEPPNHIRIVERDEFEGWVRDAGLEIVSHDYYGFYWVIWFAFFWSRGIDIAAPEDPVLQNWTKCWKALLDSEGGLEVKKQFDQFMPKSQVIVARKPG